MKGRTLCRWREKRDWSQQDAAQWAGCSYDSWRSYEKDRRIIRQWLVNMMAMQDKLDALTP